MIEAPEAYSLAKQLEKELKGKKIEKVVAGQTPHGFAWYHGDKDAYDAALHGKKVGSVKNFGGHVELELDDMVLDLSEGLNLTYLEPGVKHPPKHQLLVEFDDGSALVAKAQMYGGLFAFPKGKNDNPYYLVGKEKPNPLTDEFDRAYFDTLLAQVDPKKTTVKAFLATEQRIPGLGNGTLQEILLSAKVNPRSKLAALDAGEIDALYKAVKGVLGDMAEKGGRDTEKDIYGKPGGYQTVMSKNNKTMTCLCGGAVTKETFMGGSVYYCLRCQPIKK